MGFPHITIFLLRASYAPKTSIFMIGMLVQWVRIKFGWKLSRQFLGIFFHEKWPIFILFLELWRCQGTQNCSFWKFIWCITRATTYSLFWIGKTSQKGCLSSSKCPHPAVNWLRDAFLEIFLLASPYTLKAYIFINKMLVQKARIKFWVKTESTNFWALFHSPSKKL